MLDTTPGKNNTAKNTTGFWNLHETTQESGRKTPWKFSNPFTPQTRPSHACIAWGPSLSGSRLNIISDTARSTVPQKVILGGVSHLLKHLPALSCPLTYAPILVITASNNPFLLPVVRNSGSFSFIDPDSRFGKYDHNIHQQRCSKLQGK